MVTGDYLKTVFLKYLTISSKARDRANRMQRAYGYLYVLISCVFVLYSSSVSAQDSTLPKAPYINSQEVRQWMDAGRAIQFVDVRKPAKFDAGHLPDAREYSLCRYPGQEG